MLFTFPYAKVPKSVLETVKVESKIWNLRSSLEKPITGRRRSKGR